MYQFRSANTFCFHLFWDSRTSIRHLSSISVRRTSNLIVIKIILFRPYVEYKGTVPQADLQSKQKELELEANNLISKGGKVSLCF